VTLIAGFHGHYFLMNVQHVHSPELECSFITAVYISYREGMV